MSPKAKATAKKPPNCSRKPTTKAKAAKEAASDSDSDMAMPAPKKKPGVVKGKPGRKKKKMEPLDSCDSDQATGNKDGGSDVGDDIDDKVE
jgi:hypothetical protein